MVLRYHGGKQDLQASVNRGLIFALVNSGKIETSKPRGYEVRRLVERIISIAKKDDVTARRRVLSAMDGDRESTARIFAVILPRFRERVGGYTTFVNLGRRRGDSAERVRVTWVGGNFVEDKEIKTKSEKVKTTKDKVKRAKRTEKKEKS